MPRHHSLRIRLASALCVAALAGCAPSRERPAGDADAAFVGSARCGACHDAEYAAWRGSQHAAAMQVATPATVLGDFGDAAYTEDGVTSRFTRRGDAYVVRTIGADGAMHDFTVTHTFGVFPLQQYLVAASGGRLQPLTLAWDSRPPAEGGGRWRSLDAVAPLGADDDGHWSGRGMNWNYMCADCHATAVRKGYVADADSFDTRFAELGVGCEGCHGPGARHARWGARPSLLRATVWRDPELPARLDERRGVTWRATAGSPNAVRSVPRTTSRELDTCAQCHARRAHIADGYTAGAPLLDYYDPLPLLPSLHFPDGQQRDEVYNHAVFLQSRMHAAGVTCADCHEPHSQKLRRPGNLVCAQCHAAATYDTSAHHGHAAGTAGASCASCHMPVTTYMEIDGRHDHGIRIPRPDRSATLGVPNACGACHAGRDAAWAMGAIRSWGGRGNPGAQRFAEAFAADERGGAGARDSLLAVARDASELPVVRASALGRLARHPGAGVLAVAGAATRDTNPLVRRWALEALEATAPMERLAVVAPLLADERRAVRMKAAWLLAPVADSLRDAASRVAWRRASADFVASQRYNADRAEARVTLGAFFLARGDTVAGVAEFERAWRDWPRHFPALLNLVAVDALRGADGEQAGERRLRQALARFPAEGELHHELARSLARQGRIGDAVSEARAATRLAPDDLRFQRTLQALLGASRRPSAPR